MSDEKKSETEIIREAVVRARKKAAAIENEIDGEHTTCGYSLLEELATCLEEIEQANEARDKSGCL